MSPPSTTTTTTTRNVNSIVRDACSSSTTDLESMATFHVLSSLTSTAPTDTPAGAPTTTVGQSCPSSSSAVTTTNRQTIPAAPDRLVSQNCLLVFSLLHQKQPMAVAVATPSTSIGQLVAANGSQPKKTSVSFELNQPMGCQSRGKPSHLAAKGTGDVVETSRTNSTQPELVASCLYGHGRPIAEVGQNLAGHESRMGENGQYENLVLLKTSADQTSRFALDSSAVPPRQSSVLHHKQPPCPTSTTSPTSYEYLSLPTVGNIAMATTNVNPIITTTTTASGLGNQPDQVLIPGCLPSSSSTSSSSCTSKPPDVLVSADSSPVEPVASTGNSPSSSITSSEPVWVRKQVRHVHGSPRGPSMKSRLNSLLRQPVKQLTKRRKRRPSAGRVDPAGCRCRCHHLHQQTTGLAIRSNSLRLGNSDGLVEASKKVSRPKARSFDPFSGKHGDKVEKKPSATPNRSQYPPNPSSSTSSNSFYYKIFTEKERTGKLTSLDRGTRDPKQCRHPVPYEGKSHELVEEAQLIRRLSSSSLSEISSSSTASIPSTTSTAGSSTASPSLSNSTSSSLDVRMANNSHLWHYQHHHHSQQEAKPLRRHSDSRKQRHWRQKYTSCQQRTDRAATFDHVTTTEADETGLLFPGQAKKSTPPGLPRHYTQQQQQHGCRYRGHREVASGEARRKTDPVSMNTTIDSWHCHRQAVSNCCSCQPAPKTKISACPESSTNRRRTPGLPTTTLSCQCLQALPCDDQGFTSRLASATRPNRLRMTSGSPGQEKVTSNNNCQRWSGSARFPAEEKHSHLLLLGRGHNPRVTPLRRPMGREHLVTGTPCGCAEESRGWSPWCVKTVSGPQ